MELIIAQNIFSVIIKLTLLGIRTYLKLAAGHGPARELALENRRFSTLILSYSLLSCAGNSRFPTPSRPSPPTLTLFVLPDLDSNQDTLLQRE